MAQSLIDFLQSLSVVDLFVVYAFISFCVVYYLLHAFPRTSTWANISAALLWPGLVILFIVATTLDTMFPEGT